VSAPPPGATAGGARVDSVIALGGPPGSGKTTAGRALAERARLAWHSAGELFREEARRHGMDLAAFSRYAETHPEVDRALDDRMLGFARPGVLLEGRIQGPLCRRRGIPVRYVVVTARETVRAERLARRDGGDPAAALVAMRAREASERDRYLRFYGIDLSREPADVTIDSSDLDPAGVAEALLRALGVAPRA